MTKSLANETLQEAYLNALRAEKIPVSVYLQNGVKLLGQIESFDDSVLILRNSGTQIVYKHAISTIVPGRALEQGSGAHS